MELGGPFHIIERQMMKIASLRLDKTIEKEGRTVMLSVSCSVIVQKVSDADSVNDVAENLDDFVATKSV